MQMIKTWYIRKLVLCSFNLNQKCCRHHHVNQRTVCNCVCMPLHLRKWIRVFAAVCISVCDIILGFKLSSVMPSGKRHMSDFAMTDDCGLLANICRFSYWYRRVWGQRKLSIMFRNETLSLSLGFSQISNRFFKSQMENKRGHVNRALQSGSASKNPIQFLHRQ